MNLYRAFICTGNRGDEIVLEQPALDCSHITRAAKRWLRNEMENGYRYAIVYVRREERGFWSPVNKMEYVCDYSTGRDVMRYTHYDPDGCHYTTC